MVFPIAPDLDADRAELDCLLPRRALVAVESRVDVIDEQLEFLAGDVGDDLNALDARGRAFLRPLPLF